MDDLCLKHAARRANRANRAGCTGTLDRGGKQGKEGKEGKEGIEGIMNRALRQVLAHRPMGQKVQTGQIGLIPFFGTWTHGADGANRAYRYVCLPKANPGTYGADGAKSAIVTCVLYQPIDT